VGLVWFESRMTITRSPDFTSALTCRMISSEVELPSISVIIGDSSCCSMARRLCGRISMSTPTTRPRPMAFSKPA
jgi:hypothetical protein